MNHDLLKSIIYDQHEIIKNFQIIPSDSCLEMVDQNRANACKIFLRVGLAFAGQAEILPIFDIVPMKFSDGEKEISDYWKKYYEELGVSVPAGQPVTNPGQRAKSEKLKYIGKLEF